MGFAAMVGKGRLISNHITGYSPGQMSAMRGHIYCPMYYLRYRVRTLPIEGTSPAITITTNPNLLWCRSDPPLSSPFIPQLRGV